MAGAKLFTAGFKTSILPAPTRGTSAISGIIFVNFTAWLVTSTRQEKGTGA